MTPHKSRGRGTFMVDRTWHGVRIYRASGTTDAEVYRALDVALADLKRSSDIGLSTRLAVWGALADGSLHPLRFLEQVRRYGFAGLKTGPRGADLAAAIARWLERGPTTKQGKPLAASTVESYRFHLEEHVVPRGGCATVDDLPAIVRRVLDEEGPGTGAVVRTAALALARSLAGRHSDLWQRVSDITPPTVAQHERVGLPVADARAIARDLGKDGLVWWTLCTTGMRVKIEYLANAWTVHDTHIEVGKSKTPAGKRVIPRIGTPIRSPIAYTTLSPKLRALGVSAHIARYTFQHWMQEVGIPKARRDLYFGHKLSGLEIYGRHEVLGYVNADRKRLLELIGPEPTALQAVP